MRKWIKLAAVAVVTASVACFSSAVPTTTTLLDTGFRASDTPAYADGDLAGQQAWRWVDGTATNACNIADSAGNGYATTIGTMISVTNGNYVYLTNAVPNATSNELYGTMNFAVSTSTNEFGGYDFLHLGLSTTKTNKLDPASADDVYLSFATGANGDIKVFARDGAPGPEQIATLLCTLPTASAHWAGGVSNFVSDPLSLTWKIRKTTIANTYQLSCSLTNLVLSTNSVRGNATVIRPTAYSASSTYLVMGHPQDAYSSNKLNTTEFTIDQMSITNSTEVIPTLFPSVVAANPLNNLVRLSWPLCVEAQKLTLYRSSTDTNPASFFAVPGCSNVTGNTIGYDDSSVANGGIYYYKVVWSANGAVDAVSAIIDAEPNPERTGNIFTTDFVTQSGVYSVNTTNFVTGDLAGQARWKAIVASGKPAFKVESGFASTAPYSNSFDNVNGNQVYFNEIMSNTVAAAWSGTTVFKLSATTETGLTRVITNVVADVTNINSQAIALIDGIRVFDFGISSDTATTILDPRSKAGDLLVNVRPTSDASITVQLNGYNTSANVMITVPRANLGWDPEWAGYRTTNAPDFETDPITLNWKIRKTGITSVYSATASLTVGTNSYTGKVEFTDDSITQPVSLWSASPAYVRFGMSHAFQSQTNSTNTMVNVAIDSMSLNHNYDEPPMYAPPETLTGVIGNTNVTLKWFGAPEAATNSFEIWRSQGYGKTNPGDYALIKSTGTNAFSLTGYTYTDTNLINQALYYYKIVAVYSGVTNRPETDPLAFRARDKAAVLTWDAVNKVTANANFPTTAAVDVGGVRTYYGTYTNVLDGTNKALMYCSGVAGVGGPGTYANTTNGATVYGFTQTTATNGIAADLTFSQWRMLTTSYEQITRKNNSGSASNASSSLLYIITNSPIDLAAGEYVYDLTLNNNVAVRPALRQSNKWYVTDILYSSDTLITVDIYDPTNQWRELSITSDILMNGTNNPIVTNLTFTAVDAVGAFLDQSTGNFRPKLLQLSKLLTPLPKYTITTTVINSNATPEVFISPQDPLVKLGDSQSFVVSGGTGGLFRVASLKTNGTDVATYAYTNRVVNFTMVNVETNWTLEATFTNAAYNLTINNGFGSGVYTVGELVTIWASNPPPGMIFYRWDGANDVLTNGNFAATNTVLMKPKNATLTAAYIFPTYKLVVSNGTGSASNLPPTTQVSISADAPAPGYVFDTWTGDTNALLSNTVSTTVNMPSANVLVIANYKIGTFELTASAGAGGTITPTTTNVTLGANETFTITANSYYRIAKVETNGADTGLTFDNNSTTTNFVWPNVQATGAVYATFQPQVTTGPVPVPYEWLASYFTTNNYDACALADQDGDGMKTGDEYIAGTSPTNATSLLKATQAPRNVVTWSPVTGRYYSVYWSTNLLKGFTNIQDNIVHPQGSYTNTSPSTKVNSYQIKVRMQ